MINQHFLLHSKMWLEIWVDLSCSKDVRSLVPISQHTENWKWFRNVIAKAFKLWNEDIWSSIYHFSATSIKVIWKLINLIMSSISEFDEHHIWKVITWVASSSLSFPLNLGMFKGNFVGTEGDMTKLSLTYRNISLHLVCIDKIFA